MTITQEMSARKYAWQILHAELRRRVNPDEGLDTDPQLLNIALLFKRAQDEGLVGFDLVLELAGFGATFAQVTQNDPLGVAARIEQQVMSEPDDEDDDEDDYDYRTSDTLTALNSYTGTDIWRDVIRNLPGFDGTRTLQPYDDDEDLRYGDRFIADGSSGSEEYRFSYPHGEWVAWGAVDDQGMPLL